MSVRRLAGNTASAIVGVLVGALLVLAGDSLTRTPDPTPTPQSHEPAIRLIPGKGKGTAIVTPGRVLLAWSPQDIPARTEPVLEKTRGVGPATTVAGGLDWIHRSRAADGTVVDDPPESFGIPIEIAVVDPKEYAPFVAPADRAAVLSLRPGEALLSKSAALQRDAGAGLRIELATGTVEVTGVIADTSASGYELVIPGPVPDWGKVDHFVLAQLGSPAARERASRTIRGLLEPGAVARIRIEGETPFLRYGDAVLPQVVIKSVFGEFAARPLPDGGIEMDPAWRARNIATRPLPILGAVTCHKALFPQLRSALKEIVAAGLDYAIDPGQFAGCYSPRFIDGRPVGRLSHHSWGIAFDINHLENAYGTKADLDRRLVEILESWGFTWGGRWLIPDGMHFEWVRFP